MSAQVLPYTESRLPSSRTTSTERCAARASFGGAPATRPCWDLGHRCRGAEPGAGEVRGLLVGDEPASLQRNDPVGRPSGLLGVVRAEQNSASVGRVRPQNPVQPTTFGDGEPAGGIIEDEGVPMDSSAQARPRRRSIPRRTGAEPFVAQAHEPDDLHHFVDAPNRGTDGRAHHAELSADRTRGMARHLAQEHPDFTHGMGDPVQWTASEVGDSAAPLEFEHEPQHRRLARARGSEERCDTTRARLEGHVVKKQAGELAAGDCWSIRWPGSLTAR